MLLRAEFEPLEVEAPPELIHHATTTKEGNDSSTQQHNNDRAILQWLYEHHQDQLLRAMSITTRKKGKDFCSPLEQQRGRNHIYPSAMRLRLLDCIGRVQRQFMQNECPKILFGRLLEEMLDLTDSEYGFIGEMKYEDDGTMYLQTHAITNIAWDEATNAFYEDNAESGLKFYNLDSLFGKVMTTKQYVISNNPKNDSRAAGIPEGHPALDHFFGMPFFDTRGEMNGMVGIANKPGGYSEADVAFLEPLTVTCSNLIQAYLQMQENERLINTLEEKVNERTKTLQLINDDLERANQRVLEASAAQLKHFACMSHEIRTPLNCIIGLSSLFIESDLTQKQKESMKMIISSGNLLLAVVNDVLDYSKLESGNVDIEISNNNLQEILDSTVHSIETKARSKRVRIKTIYDPTIPEVIKTDGRRLQQILYNLLGNAVKFSKEDSTVELSVTTANDDGERSNNHRNDNDNVEQQHNVIVCDESPILLPPAEEPHPHRHTIQRRLSHSQKDIAMSTSSSSSSCPFGGGGSPKSPLPSRRMNGSNAMSTLLSSTCPFGDGGNSSSSDSPLQSPAKKWSNNKSKSSSSSSCSSCPFGSSPTSLTSRTTTCSASSSSSSPIKCPFTRQPCTLLEEVPAGILSVTEEEEESKDTDTDDDCTTEERTEQVLRIIVKDYGKGIEEKDYDKIFEPFQQASKDTERLYGGTGLGLAITKKLVQVLGGTITVDSVPGQWAQFTVEFSFVDELVNVQDMSACLEHTTLILVDPDVSTRETMASIFQAYQVNYRICHDAAEAERLLSAEVDQKQSFSRSFIWLIHEGLYDEATFHRLKHSGGGGVTNSTLVTFGPHFTVTKGDLHIRSLVQTLPSVLMRSLCTCAKNVKSLSTSSSRISHSTAHHEGIFSPCAFTTARFQDIHVLVAEDNLINQKVLAHMLQRLGVKHVDIVDNGEKAVEKEAQNRYDLVLMDMQMPVMDGLEACKLILGRQPGGEVGGKKGNHHHHHHHHHSPPLVVFVTAQVSTETEVACFSAGAAGFLPKPFNIREITKLFQRLHFDR